MRLSVWNRGLKITNGLLPSVLLVGGVGIGLLGCDTQPTERASGYYYEKQAVSDGRSEGKIVEEGVAVEEVVADEVVAGEVAHSIELAQFVEAGEVDEASIESDDSLVESIHLEAESHTFHFGFDKVALDDSALETLRYIATLVESYPAAIILIDGHADRQGDERYNRFLSEQRADQVVKRLMQYGVPSDNFVIQSHGSTEASDDNRSSRRVELSIMSAEAYANLQQEMEVSESAEINMRVNMEEGMGENMEMESSPVESAQLEEIVPGSKQFGGVVQESANL